MISLRSLNLKTPALTPMNISVSGPTLSPSPPLPLPSSPLPVSAPGAERSSPHRLLYLSLAGLHLDLQPLHQLLHAVLVLLVLLRLEEQLLQAPLVLAQRLHCLTVALLLRLQLQLQLLHLHTGMEVPSTPKS